GLSLKRNVHSARVLLDDKQRISPLIEPLVSVLVASFNHERFIEQALDSVVNQSYRNFELIIVDDCSTDGSVARIRHWIEQTGQPTVFIINEENKGICAVLNQLFDRSSGHFCIYLDSDDWMEPERIRHHVSYFESLDPDVALVFGDASVRYEDGRPMGETFLRRVLGDEAIPEDDAVFDRLLVANFIPTSTVMVRRSAIITVGGYDESLSYDDYDMWLRLSHRFRFSYCEGVVANYRVVPSSMSHSMTWKPLMIRSSITIFERWAAVDEVRMVPSRRLAVADHLRWLARRIAPHDVQCANGALRTAEELVPSLRGRLLLGLRVFSLPGGPRLIESLSMRAQARQLSKAKSAA
ncbi:MAG: glycosyltransferase, partial [Actinomycetes bacterium]